MKYDSQACLFVLNDYFNNVGNFLSSRFLQNSLTLQQYHKRENVYKINIRRLF